GVDPDGASEERDPRGLRVIRTDFAHFCMVHAAGDWRSRLRVLLVSRSFWALALYRFGRSVYARPRSLVRMPLRAVYKALFEIVRLLTKTSFSVHARIEGEVWIAPHGEVFISLGARVG